MLKGQARWIHGAGVDVAVALCWVPFALVGHAAESRGSDLATVVTAVLLLSFSHQPLTLALVYGDPQQFRLRRAIFTWSPLVFVLAVWGGRHLSLLLVAAVAGLWNAEHTLMQRYGVTRIYGRKVGQEDGRLERAMLLSWLVLALIWVAADPALPTRINRLRLGDVNANGLHLLADFRPVAAAFVVPAIAVAVVLAGRWVRREAALGAGANPAKHLYVASTAALFVVILVDPLAGFVAYVGSHAVEYFVIVHHTLDRRYRAAPDGGGALGQVVRAPAGRAGFFAAYGCGVVFLVALLRWHDSPSLTSVVFLTLGGLHVFFDGFIWKLRRPAVASRSRSARTRLWLPPNSSSSGVSLPTTWSGMGADQDVFDGLDDGFAAAVLDWFEGEPVGAPAEAPAPPDPGAPEPWDSPWEPEPAATLDTPVAEPFDTELDDEGGEDDDEDEAELELEHDGGDDGYTSDTYRDGAGSRWVLALVVLAVIAMLAFALSMDGDGSKDEVRADGTSTTESARRTTLTSSATSVTSTQATATTAATASTATTVPSTATTIATGATLLPSLTSTTLSGATTTTTSHAAPPPALRVTGASIVFGTTATTLYLDLANTGGLPLSWSAHPTLPGSWVTPSSGVVQPGGHGPIAVKLDRGVAPEGSLTGQLQVSSNGGNVVLPMTAEVNHPPVVWTANASPTVIHYKPGCGPIRSTVTSTVTDTSTLTVTLFWDDGTVGGQGDQIPMVPGANNVWTASLGPFQHVPGGVRWWIEAADSRGNKAWSSIGSVSVVNCSG